MNRQGKKEGRARFTVALYPNRAIQSLGGQVTERKAQAKASSGRRGGGVFQLSKTIENLKAAFAGESQARNKYTFFAEVARDEGYH